MNVKDVIKLAATYLQLEDVLNMNILGGEELLISEQTQKNFNLLFQAVNLVYEEIACDYILLRQEDKVVVENEMILFSDLSKKISQVLRLKNESQKNCAYRLYPSYIKIPNGIYELEYSYIPTAVTIDDNLETFSNKISARVISYAVASEYALINGLYDEATTWKKRFEDAIGAVVSKKSAIELPCRRWY